MSPIHQRCFLPKSASCSRPSSRGHRRLLPSQAGRGQSSCCDPCRRSAVVLRTSASRWPSAGWRPGSSRNGRTYGLASELGWSGAASVLRLRRCSSSTRRCSSRCCRPGYQGAAHCCSGEVAGGCWVGSRVAVEAPSRSRGRSTAETLWMFHLQLGTQTP